MADNFFKKPSQKKLDSYQAQEAAKHANMLRLHAERLAREAAGPPIAKPETPKKNPLVANPK